MKCTVQLGFGREELIAARNAFLLIRLLQWNSFPLIGEWLPYQCCIWHLEIIAKIYFIVSSGLIPSFLLQLENTICSLLCHISCTANVELKRLLCCSSSQKVHHVYKSNPRGLQVKTSLLNTPFTPLPTRISSPRGSDPIRQTILGWSQEKQSIGEGPRWETQVQGTAAW